MWIARVAPPTPSKTVLSISASAISPAAVGLLPEGPPAGIGGQELEAGERGVGDALLAEGNGDHPGLPAQLAVGDDVQAGRFLERDDLADGAVLHRAQLGGAHRPRAR